ncbi:hypothetical protein BaRGS_00021038 [Batillaria attramentaria]|uniref:Uncharacterized protein n=1 Tax=Batillaria attramentaria TaxID=370345 RepID=A0ABD0KL28_9CAEN
MRVKSFDLCLPVWRKRSARHEPQLYLISQLDKLIVGKNNTTTTNTTTIRTENMIHTSVTEDSRTQKRDQLASVASGWQMPSDNQVRCRSPTTLRS